MTTIVGTLFLAGCTTTTGSNAYDVAIVKTSFVGSASWYSSGYRTASGERFNTNDLTIAHKSLPFGTRVRLTNLNNNKTVIARVNDRGPFVPGRVVDTSRQVASILGFLPQGTAPLKVEVLK